MHESGFLRLGQFEGGNDFGLGNSLPATNGGLESLGDFRQEGCALMIDDYKKKIANDGAGADTRGKLLHDVALGFFADCRTGKRVAKFERLVIGVGKIGELSYDGLRIALGDDIGESVCVLMGRGFQLSLSCRLCTKRLTMDS